jgi:Uma2 family endonuclease
VPCDIAVEVITPTPRDTRRDRIDKAHEYARFGVRWYWLVDPAMGTLEIFELGTRGRYELAAAASAGRVRVPGCRGLVLDLDALWRKVGPVE